MNESKAQLSWNIFRKGIIFLHTGFSRNISSTQSCHLSVFVSLPELEIHWIRIDNELRQVSNDLPKPVKTVLQLSGPSVGSAIYHGAAQ